MITINQERKLQKRVLFVCSW